MDDILLQAIVAKHGGRFYPRSTVFNIAAGATHDYQINLPDTPNIIGYLISVKGYTQGGDIKVELFDNKNIKLYTWDEYIDTEESTEILPFTEKFYIKNATFRFTNSGAVAQDIGWYTIWIYMPNENRINFETAIKEVADLIPLLRNISDNIGAIRWLTQQREPTVEEEPDPVLNLG